GQLFFGKESPVQCSAGAGWFAISTSCLGTVAFNSSRRNALLFLDGEETRRRRDAPRSRARQWRQYDLHHYSVSPCYSSGWITLWLRRRIMAEKMVARSRAALCEAVTSVLD